MKSQIVHAGVLPSINRREALCRMGGGFGMVGFANILGDSLLKAVTPNTSLSSLAVKPPHFAPKAKRVIFLFLNGGLSQVDTFDPKPMLSKEYGHPLPSGNLNTEPKTGNRILRSSSFTRY